MRRSIFNLLILATLFFNGVLVALDTNEPYNVGPTDFEFYLTHTNTSQTSINAITGYGHSHIWNPTLSYFCNESVPYHVLSIGNIATLPERLRSIDVLTFINLSQTQTQLAFGLEFVEQLFEIQWYFQPYYQWTLSPDTHSLFLPLGIWINPNSRTVEYFVQFDRTLGQSPTWGGAVGANITMGHFEIIVETGLRPNYYISLGTILTLD